MPEFKVIDGGGERISWEREAAEKLFRAFAVALVRGLGSGTLYPITTRFFEFLRHMQTTNLPVGPVIDAAMQELRKDAFRLESGQPDYEVESDALRLQAWRCTVEYMTHDGLARARQSKRDSDMLRAIDRYIVSCEQRSRENGWSYLQNRVSHLGKWPPRANRHEGKTTKSKDINL